MSEALEVSRITITRTIQDSEDLIDVEVQPGSMSVLEFLGTLELAKGYEIHERS